MTLALIVWLVMTVIPAIKIIGYCIVGIVLAAILVLLIEWSATFGDAPDEWDRVKKACKHLKWALPLLIVTSLVPGTKTAWYMVGAYAAETAVTSEVAGELGGAAKDMMLELMKKAKQEIGEVDGEAVKDAAKAAIQEVSK